MHIFIYHFRFFIPILVFKFFKYSKFVLLFLVSIHYFIAPFKVVNAPVSGENSHQAFVNAANLKAEIASTLDDQQSGADSDLNKKLFANNIFHIDSLQASYEERGNFFEPIFETGSLKPSAQFSKIKNKKESLMAE